MWRGVMLWLVAAAWAPMASAAVTVTTLAADGGPFTAATVSPNGQTVYVIDASRGSVVAIDPSGGRGPREVVAGAASGHRPPLAVVAIPGDVLALVCRHGDAWSLVTHRLRPGEVAKVVGQDVGIGVAAGPAAPVAAVSRTRDWLVVAGLPAPLPPVVRAVFAGGTVRRLPDGAAADSVARPGAVAVSPADELVICEPGVGGQADDLVYLAAAGRELLRLGTGVRGIRGAAFTRDDGDLYVTAAGGEGGRHEGLWRLDAVLEDGEQAVRPTLVAALVAPRAVVAVSSQSLVVIHGADSGTISRIDVNDEATEVIR